MCRTFLNLVTQPVSIEFSLLLIVLNVALQPEEVDAKATEIISEAVLKQLADSNWKERLAGIEALTEVFMNAATAFYVILLPCSHLLVINRDKVQ